MENNQYKSTIMVIDDTLDNLEIMEEILSANNYSVSLFSDGEMALKSAEKNKPDLILLDIMMPIISGYEVSKRLKSKDELKDIPVLFISALKDTVSKVKAFEYGGLDYITKPFQKEEVLARVKTHIELANAKKILSLKQIDLQQEINKTLADLSQAQKLAKLGNWRISFEDGSVTWSDITYKIYGLSANEVINEENYFDYVWHEDRKMVRKLWKNILEGNEFKEHVLEYRIIYKDSFKWITTIVEYEYDVEGNKKKAVFGTVMDNTRLKNSLNELLKKNETLRQIAWAQSHLVRSLLMRLMAYLHLMKDEDYEDMTNEQLLNSMDDTVNELDREIQNIGELLNQS
jgi:DNA-binding response OmpR family regulator